MLFRSTNGIKITKEYAKELKDSGLEILYVSIDSPVPEKHDELRGMKGLFNTAVQGIKDALEVGLNCQLSTYITKENLANGDFERVIQLARDLGATGVRYLLPTPTGRWLYKLDVMLTPEEQKKVRKIAEFPYKIVICYEEAYKIFPNRTSHTYHHIKFTNEEFDKN